MGSTTKPGGQREGKGSVFRSIFVDKEFLEKDETPEEKFQLHDGHG